MIRSMPARGGGPPAVSKQPTALALAFRPSAPSTSLISLVRCFIEDFYAEVINSRGTASRLALVVHELVENAAKYSTDGETALFVECDLPSCAISVRTANRATEARIGQLRRAFAEIAAAPDAASLYMEAMRRCAVGESRSSGLGLARIWAECDMVLCLAVEGERVEITARGQITG
jgi:hypothetical protein